MFTLSFTVKQCSLLYMLLGLLLLLLLLLFCFTTIIIIVTCILWYILISSRTLSGLWCRPTVTLYYSFIRQAYVQQSLGAQCLPPTTGLMSTCPKAELNNNQASLRVVCWSASGLSRPKLRK